MNFNWKILEVSAEDGVITHARYHVTAFDDFNTVESEGNWWFSDKTVKIPFIDVKEENIAEWIEKESSVDGVSHIKSNLERQLKALAKNDKVALPWLPQTFTL